MEEKNTKKQSIKTRHRLNEWQAKSLQRTSLENSLENTLLKDFYKPRGEFKKLIKSEGTFPPQIYPQNMPEEPLNKAEHKQNKIEDNSPPFLYKALRPLGQISASYIIAEGNNEIYIIDQHAAHERILYEKFKEKAAKSSGEAQNLAIPITLELSHEEASLLTEYILQISDLGFILEHFGDNTFILRAVPSWYEGSDPQGLIYELLARGKNASGSKIFLPRHEELFKSL